MRPPRRTELQDRSRSAAPAAAHLFQAGEALRALDGERPAWAQRPARDCPSAAEQAICGLAQERKGVNAQRRPTRPRTGSTQTTRPRMDSTQAYETSHRLAQLVGVVTQPILEDRFNVLDILDLLC